MRAPRQAWPDTFLMPPGDLPVVSTISTFTTTATTVLLEHTTAAAGFTTTATTTAAATAAAAAAAITAATAATTAAIAATAATTTAIAAIAATAATAAIATAAATTAATAATAAAAFFAGPGFVDGQRSIVEVFAIQCVDCRTSASIIHLDKGEAAWATRLSISDQVNALHFTMLAEVLAKIIFACRVGEIPHIDAHHRNEIRVPERTGANHGPRGGP